jgi:hypothetical protein
MRIWKPDSKVNFNLEDCAKGFIPVVGKPIFINFRFNKYWLFCCHKIQTILIFGTIKRRKLFEHQKE